MTDGVSEARELEDDGEEIEEECGEASGIIRAARRTLTENLEAKKSAREAAQRVAALEPLPRPPPPGGVTPGK